MADADMYRGQNGSIQIAGDELIVKKGGLVTRAVIGEEIWRVPLASIREVLFRDSKLTGGHLHLVIGNAVAPKNSLLGATGAKWTIEFKVGKQAKRFRELRAWLEHCVQHYRAQGVDPATARQPYADTTASEELNLAKQRMLGDSLVTQPHSDASASEVVALARQQTGYREMWPDLDSLPTRVAVDEPVRLLAAGLLGVSPALIALTDRRVLFHSDNASSRKYDELPLDGLEVSWNSGLLHGGLVFRASGRQVKVSGLSDATATAFVEEVQVSPATPTGDVLGQLEKLGELHRAGVLTDDEFAVKKTELLGRI